MKRLLTMAAAVLGGMDVWPIFAGTSAHTGETPVVHTAGTAVLQAAPATLPATAPAGPQAVAVEFLPPYEVGCRYRLEVVSGRRVFNGTYRADDPLVDALEARRYEVSVEGDLLRVRLADRTERGNMTSPAFGFFYGGREHSDYSSHDQAMPDFEAVLDAAGRIASCRTAEQMCGAQVEGYSQNSTDRRNLFLRSQVEEVGAYFPPRPMTAGQSWTVSRQVRLPGDTTRERSETATCRLGDVKKTPEGWLAVITVQGGLGAPASPGGAGAATAPAWSIRKSGRVEYNISTGLVRHTVRLEGVTEGGRLEQEVRIVLTPMEKPAAAPPLHTHPALPALDRDGRVLFMYRRGTWVQQQEDGELWVIPPHPPADPDNARRLGLRKPPMASVNPYAVDLGGREHVSMERKDNSGRVWGHGREGVTWTQDGKVHSREFKGFYSKGPRWRRDLAGRCGKNLFFDVEGHVLAAGEWDLHVFDGKSWTTHAQPWQGKAPTLGDNQWVLMRQLGRRVVVARNLEYGQPRSIIADYRDGVLSSTPWIACQHVSFLAQRKDDLLVGTQMGLWRMSPPAATPPADGAALARLIERLSGLRGAQADQAAEELIKLGPAVRETVTAEAARTKDLDCMLRLRHVLSRLGQGGEPWKIAPADIEGYRILDPLWETRSGWQVFRPWREMEAEAEPFLLCLHVSGRTRRIALPAGAGLVSLNLEQADGRVVGLTARSAIELDLESAQVRELFALGAFAWDPELRIVAVGGGRYCIRTGLGDGMLTFWYDPRGQAERTMLRGRVLADRVPGESNCEPQGMVCPDAAGRRLWLLRQEDPIRHRLCFVEGDEMKRVEGLFSGDRPGLLPLSQGCLFLPGVYWPVALVDAQGTVRAPRLSELVRQNIERLRRLLPPDVLCRFRRATWPEGLLALGGESVWVHEEFVRRFANGMEIKPYTALLDVEATHEVTLERLAGMEGRRLLAFAKDCRSLVWVGPDGQAPVESREFCWAWCVEDRMGWPFHAGAWTISPSSLDRLADKIRKEDPDLKPEDQAEFRLLQPGGTWRTFRGLPWAGGMYTTGDGCILQVRSGEVLVQFADLSQQVVELGQPCEGHWSQVAREGPGKYWLTGDESLVRLVVSSEGGKNSCRIDRCLGLRGLGYCLRGPWILQGRHMYFTSGGRLYGVGLDELD